eukprot:5961022-Prymnesium_polylepis.1
MWACPKCSADAPPWSPGRAHTRPPPTVGHIHQLERLRAETLAAPSAPARTARRAAAKTNTKYNPPLVHQNVKDSSFAL